MGDSFALLQEAVFKCSLIAGTEVLCCSPVYRTKPVGYADQSDFLNAVFLAETSLTPAELYKSLSKIEQEAGRVRLFKNGPRTLDLDIILYADKVSDDPFVTLPHPRAADRAFVLIPAADIAPDMIFTGTQKSIAQMAASLSAEEKEGVIRTDMTLQLSKSGGTGNG